jgi:low affinity Fe/Cu permease
MTENEQRRREDAARQFLDVLFVTTEHKDITKIQAFREMCEAAIAVYDGTEDQAVADWAREGLRLLDERAL